MSDTTHASSAFNIQVMIKFNLDWPDVVKRSFVLLCRELAFNCRPQNGETSRLWISKRRVTDWDDDGWDRNIPMDGTWGSLFLTNLLISCASLQLLKDNHIGYFSCTARLLFDWERRSITTIKSTPTALQSFSGSFYTINCLLRECRISKQHMQQPLKCAILPFFRFFRIWFWLLNIMLFSDIFLLQNVRPSAESLPEDLGDIVTSCWNEDPNARPNFTQIIQLLLNYLSKVGSPVPAIPLRILASKNTLLPPDSPGTSSLMAKLDECGETPKAKTEDKRKGLFFCFNQCY